MSGIESVAVLGGGTMGGGIAGYLARAGLRVALVDASHELAEQARERLLERTQGHVDAGLLPGRGDRGDRARGRRRRTWRPRSATPTS